MVKGKRKTLPKTAKKSQDTAVAENEDVRLNNEDVEVIEEHSDDATSRKRQKKDSSKGVAQAEATLMKKLFGFADADDDDSDEEEVVEKVVSKKKKKTMQSVWHDDDDEIEDQDIVVSDSKTKGSIRVDIEAYQERISKVFQKSSAGLPKWAASNKTTTSSKDDESEDELTATLNEMTRTTGKYVEKSDRVPQGYLSVSLLQDVAVGNRENRPIRVVRFHKTKPVLVTASTSGTVRLFQVDTTPKKEHFLQSVSFSRFPITSMDLVAGGNAVLCGSYKQQYFMHYDLMNANASQFKLPTNVPPQSTENFCVSSDGSLVALLGHSQQVYVLSAKTMELVSTFSSPSPVVHAQFLPKSNNELWLHTERGEVFIWNMRNQNLHSFFDEGCTRGTQLALSSDARFVACGANSGIVNVYDTDSVRKTHDAKPQLTAKALLTSNTNLAFSHDAQILAVASNVKANQLKLMHVRSGTIFSNFPDRFLKMPTIESVSFSPHSGFMASACSNGKLFLFRIDHFESY